MIKLSKIILVIFCLLFLLIQNQQTLLNADWAVFTTSPPGCNTLPCTIATVQNWQITGSTTLRNSVSIGPFKLLQVPQNPGQLTLKQTISSVPIGLYEIRFIVNYATPDQSDFVQSVLATVNFNSQTYQFWVRTYPFEIPQYLIYSLPIQIKQNLSSVVFEITVFRLAFQIMSLSLFKLQSASNINVCGVQYFKDGDCYQCIPGYEKDPITFICTCQTVLVNGICLVCSLGYNYDSVSQTCITSIENCVTYTEQNGQAICSQCIDGFQIVNQVCESTIPNCISFSDQNTCSDCQLGYDLVDNQCLASIDNCQDFDEVQGSGDIICITCSVGFQTNNQDDQCLPTIQKCTAFTDASTCSDCQLGYDLNTNECVPSIENCQEFDEVQGSGTIICIDCLPGFLTNNLNDQCVPTIDKCTAFSDASTCSDCQIGYDLTDNQCVPSIQKCIAFTDATTCSDCQLGYDLDTNQCIPSIDNCQEFDQVQGSGTIICIDCLPGFQTNNQNDECIPSIPKCTAFSDASTCQDCQLGYGLSSNQCQASIQNCQTFILSGSDVICSLCELGFDTETGATCEEVTENCLSYSLANVCQTCIPGFDKNTISVSQVQCIASIEKCTKFTNQNTCEQCQIGYEVVLNVCQPFIDNCEEFDEVQGSGDIICLTCQTGYQPNSQNDQCNPSVENCLTFNGINDCQECQPNYETNDNGVTCEPLVENCFQYSVEELCTDCLIGFTLNFQTQQCIFNNILHCSQYSQIGECLKCNPGYNLNKQLQICEPRIVPNCAAYSINRVCLTCQFGYNLDYQFNLCLKRTENCALYFQNRNCLNCIPSYIIVEKSCVKEVSNCGHYSEITKECVSCESGYNLTLNQCRLIPNCQQNQFLNQQGICKKSDFLNCGSFNQNGLCIKCKDGFRFASDLSACNKLFLPPICPNDGNSSKYVIFGQICVKIDAHCVFYLPNGLCIECQDGYYAFERKCFKYQKQ